MAFPLYLRKAMAGSEETPYCRNRQNKQKNSKNIKEKGRERTYFGHFCSCEVLCDVLDLCYHYFLIQEEISMYENLKKKSFKRSLVVTALFIVIGISFMATNAKSVFSAIKGYQRFEDLAPDAIKDQKVEIDVTACIGPYMEEYSENTSTHRKTTTHLYYLIQTGDENAVDSRFMTIKVPKKYQSQMDKLAEGTSTEPLHLAGEIKPLDYTESRTWNEFLVELFIYWGADTSQIDQLSLPYYINATGTTPATGSESVYVLLFVLGIALVIIGIYRIIKGATGGFIKKFQKAVEEAGCTEASVEADMNSATSYEKKETIKIGRLFTYYSLNSAVPIAIPNKKMLWAYQNTTTHRTNGVKTGVTYSVMIYVDGEKNAHTISVSTEAIAQEMLAKIATTLPWVIVGYSDELRKLYRKDRAQFLQLRYNTVEHVAVEPGFENTAASTDAAGSTNTDNNTNE